jgi:hypothetical protein
MSGAIPMNGYLTPEQAAAMAGIEDPNDRMNTMAGMQRYANMLPQMNQIKERSNGRVVGRTDPMEGLSQMGSQLAGAYMNKNLMDKYGAIMDANNKQRMSTAQMIAEALRRAPAAGAAVPGTAQSYPVSPQNPAIAREIPAYTPHEIDYYGGY